MPSATLGQTPSLSTFIKSLDSNPVERSVELLVSLLKRRQIRNSRQCALATTELLMRVVEKCERRTGRDPEKLVERIRDVGRRLVAAQPREMAVGNIVRRVLDIIREVAEGEQAGTESEDNSAPLSPTTGPTEGSRPALLHSWSTFNPLSHPAALPQDLHARPRTPADGSPRADLSFDTAAAKRPALNASISFAGTGPAGSSLLAFLDHPGGRGSGGSTPNLPGSPGHAMLSSQELPKARDLKFEVLEGMTLLHDELKGADAQIAESALDHIHSNETILTHTSSQTIQRFLATAAKKRKFTVVHAEAYPNDHLATHATILNGSTAHSDQVVEDKWKSLTSLGITVILIPDTAVYAMMSRINKVLLAPPRSPRKRLPPRRRGRLYHSSRGESPPRAGRRIEWNLQA